MSNEKPNIVMIVMDTARAQTFSCYGGDANTPFLDSIAENNIKYERGISQQVWTLPSHASMFTGKYPSEHKAAVGEKKGFHGLDMIQKKLSSKGYTNIGVVNVAFLWPKFGFDRFFDRYDYINKNYLSGNGLLEGFEQGDSVLKKVVKVCSNAYDKNGIGGVFGLFNFLGKEILLLNDSGAEETNETALDHLNELNDEPFFMFLNYIEPHGPFSPPFPYSHKYLDNKFKWLSLTSLNSFSGLINRLPRFYSSEVEVDDEELRTKEGLYNGEIEYLDSKLEELYKSIKEDYPNTVFIFTSDHGEAFGERGHYGHHASLWDEVTRVPLIEEFPDGRNEVVERPAETRRIHDHLINIADGSLELIGSEGCSVTEFRGRNPDKKGGKLSRENLKFPLWKTSVSVQDSGDKVIRGFENRNIKITDFKENEVEEVSEKLEEKAKSLISKIKDRKDS